MNKELEALERIYCHLSKVDGDRFKQDKAIIETTLKEYELLKQTEIIVTVKEITDEDLEKFKNQRMYIGSSEPCEIISVLDEETKKKLKALDIIKEHGVDVAEIMICQDYHQYEARFCENIKGRVKLNKKEFDFLKEVLI